MNETKDSTPPASELGDASLKVEPIAAADAHSNSGSGHSDQAKEVEPEPVSAGREAGQSDQVSPAFNPADELLQESQLPASTQEAHVNLSAESKIDSDGRPHEQPRRNGGSPAGEESPLILPENATNQEKCAFGEAIAERSRESQGFEKVGEHQGVHGLDGVYENPDKIVVDEVKFGSSQLGETLQGKQGSMDYIFMPQSVDISQLEGQRGEFDLTNEDRESRLKSAVGDEGWDDFYGSLLEKPLERTETRVNAAGEAEVKLLGRDWLH